jgi:hypothetical protein
VTFDEREARLRARLDALPPAARAELFTSCASQTSTASSGSAGSGSPVTRQFGELLIDLEEDKAARAVVFGLLAEMDRNR